jgi:hypothetical protein
MWQLIPFGSLVSKIYMIRNFFSAGPQNKFSFVLHLLYFQVCGEVSAFLGKCKVVHKEVGQVFPAAPQGIHRSRTPQGMHRSTQGELTSGYKRRFMSVQGVTMRRCHQERV